MKILLTGASGFIGRHIRLALIRKYGVQSVVFLTSKNIPNTNCFEYASIKNFDVNKQLFNDVSHVIHAGAFTPKNRFQSYDIDSSFNNIAYTKELLSFEFAGLVRFINLSTLDVYAENVGVISEKSEIKPVSLYASSKLYCEEMVKCFSAENNIDYMNLRIGHVYGPGEEKYKKILPIALMNALKGQPLELWGDGAELRSFIFINDVVSSIVNSLEASVKNMDVNVVSGNSISIKDLLKKISEISGKSIEIHQKESLHSARNLVFNNSLLLKTILEKETDFDEGLKSEYEYMRLAYENNI